MAMLNNAARYGAVAMILHWLVAVAIIAQLAFGTYIADLPDGDPNVHAYVLLHKSFGLSILVLSAACVLWRLMNKPPPFPENMPAWQRFAAQITHALFYILIIVLPLSGWAMSSVAPSHAPILWFNLFEWPKLPILPNLAHDQQVAIVRQIRNLHTYLADTMIGLIVLHVAAALKHHFWDRDTVLTRILPGPST